MKEEKTLSQRIATHPRFTPGQGEQWEITRTGGTLYAEEHYDNLRVIDGDSTAPVFMLFSTNGVMDVMTKADLLESAELCLESPATTGVLSWMLSQTVGPWAFEVQCSREKKWLVNVYGEAKTGECDTEGEALAAVLLMIWGEQYQ